MSTCVDDIKIWMNDNYLKLNDDKSECLLIGTSKRVSQCSVSTFECCSAQIPMSNTVRNLGVILDSELSLNDHVTKLIQSCFLQLRNIGNVRKYLTKQSAEILVLALVMSRLDYCNSILAGATKSQISRLQRVQNTAARIVTLSPKSAHITPTLQALHWLPIKHRITFKLCCLVLSLSLYGMAPLYLSDLLTVYQPTNSLRSENKRLLDVPRVRTKTFGHRTFSYSASIAWNNLPEEIRLCHDYTSFRTYLKTYLYRLSYSDWLSTHSSQCALSMQCAWKSANKLTIQIDYTNWLLLNQINK